MKILERLSERLQGKLHEPQTLQTAIDDLVLYRTDRPESSVSYLQRPSLCLILCGQKNVRLGERRYHYGSGEFACYSVDLPLVADVETGSPDRPNFGIQIFLDHNLMQPLIDKLPILPETGADVLTIGKLDDKLGASVMRLMDLLDNPQDIPALSPLILQEIYYYLLISEQGSRLRQIVHAQKRLAPVMQAAQWLKDHFAETVNMDDLAKHCGISPSAFYAAFRSLTGLSPLQYQKQLRLSEAQRLLKSRTCATSVSEVAHRVGYESASQFSREYKRLFGVTPVKEIM